jgi:Putative adhesin
MPAAPAMTTARWAVLAGGLPVVLALIALAAYGWVNGTVVYLADQSQVGYSVGFSVPTSGGQARVTDSNGDLTVRAGSGRRIVVRGHLSSSFARPSLRWRLTGGGLALNPQCFAQAGNCSLDLGVTVPAGLPVSASGSFGELDARGLDGRVTLTQNSGDLTASRLTGTVDLTNSFGTISASGLAGSIRLDNNSGDIQAAGVVGNSRFQDSFGTISVTGLAAADVVASNNSGDISLTFSKVPRRVSVTDSFGSITLVLPAGPATYRVQTRDSFGSTTVSVPRSPSAGNVITAANNSGDITIVTRKQPAPPPAPGAPGAPAGP